MLEMRAQIVNIELKYGLPEINPNKKSVIFRPFDRLINSGKPTGYLTYIFLTTNEQLSTCGKTKIHEFGEKISTDFFEKSIPPNSIKILGCLAYSTGNKIIFYPSFTTRYLIKFKQRETPEKVIENINIDHFSLEPSLLKWHITYPNGHIYDFTTKQVNEDVFHWFSISIKNSVKLEQSFKSNPFGYLCPVSDAERRVQDIADSLKGREEHLLTVPHIDEYNYSNSFWYFDFLIIKPQAGAKKIGPIFAFSRDTKINAETDALPFFTYEMKIPKAECKLIIVASKVPGFLSDDIIISYPSGN